MNAYSISNELVGGVKGDRACESELSRLKSIAKDERIENSVTFVSACGREKLKYYYSAADAFIATPWYEPFGITPLEAMACGRPVIGSRVGGIKETVLDEKAGYLVPPKDPRAVAEKIAQLYGDPSLMDSAGRRALLHVHENFTWRKVGESIADLYDSVLELSGASCRQEA